MPRKRGNNDLVNMHVRISAGEHDNEICYMLRSLFAALGNSDGQFKSNNDLRRGTNVSFGSGPIAGLFIERFECLFRKRVRNRISLRRF